MEKSEKLKPCPFCGSGWLYETQRNGYCDETPVMFCNSCKAVVTWEQVEEEGVSDETRLFVREHWDDRAVAEGECEIVEHYAASIRGEIGRERIKLSCGHIVERNSNFCQECGARIREAVRHDNY